MNTYFKTTIEGTEFIPAVKVNAWIAEARDLMHKYNMQDSTVLVNIGYGREAYKTISYAIESISKYNHTSFAYRPVLIENLHNVAHAIDNHIAFEESKTIEVIRVSDGKHIMTSPDIAEFAVEEGKAVYA